MYTQQYFVNDLVKTLKSKKKKCKYLFCLCRLINTNLTKSTSNELWMTRVFNVEMFGVKKREALM